MALSSTLALAAMVQAIRILALALAASMLPFDSAGANPPEGTPSVTVDATTLDLGRVERGTVVSESFIVSNVGSAPLSIRSLQFSSPGAQGRVERSIAPGSSEELVIDWDTADYTRDAEMQVVLELNDPALPSLVLTLDCFVVSPDDPDLSPAFDMNQVLEQAYPVVTARFDD